MSALDVVPDSGRGRRTDGRDKRWEKVQARIGPLPIDEMFHTEAEIRQLEMWMELKIWVTYNGMYYWVSQKIHRLDYEELMANDPVAYGFILNDMVQYIDREMVNHLQPPLTN